jgi:hypothetical protein
MLNYAGIVHKPHMRCDPRLHPAHAHFSPIGNVLDGGKYPTRLKDGEQPNHDDWSCVEDFMALGLVEDDGTGLNPVLRFTDAGWDLWHRFNRHIAEHPNRWSATFDPTIPEAQR